MKKIEKAAREYVNKISTDFKLDLKSFIEGANWRIDCFYHYSNEEPINNEDCLIIDKRNNAFFGKVCEDSTDFDGNRAFMISDSCDFIAVKNVKRWAYVRDLIPQNIVLRNTELRTAIEVAEDIAKRMDESLQSICENIKYVRFKDDDIPKIQTSKNGSIVLTYNNKTMSLDRLLSLMENEGYIAPEDF